MATKPEGQPTWEEFNKHEKRIKQLEKKVAELLKISATESSGQLTGSSTGPQHTSTEHAQGSHPSSSLRADDDMSPVMQSIVVQLRSGDSQGAFKEFQALPRSELASQPVTAATIAAAICVTQGDFKAGLKALEQVQQFSDDPRIEQIKQKLIEQAARK